MKKILPVILSALLVLMCLIPTVSAERTLPLFVDNADLLTSSEEASLISTLEAISASQMIEIAVVTVNSTEGKSAMEYADDFYDYNGYGYGENDDGVLLLVDMGKREWWITTHGHGMYYLDDYTLYLVENAFIDELSAGDYFGAFLAFANACNAYIEIAKNPAATDGYHDEDYYHVYPLPDYGNGDWHYDDYDSGGFSPDFIIPSVIVGFVVSFIMVSVMKSGMKSVRSASDAANYVEDGSLNLRAHSDRYLYSNTVRTRRDTSSHGGGHHTSRGGFGGSSTHRSSSGRSHGGRGGRF